MANPYWFKGMKSPHPTGATRYRERFSKVEKKSSLQKKIALYLTKKWGRMIDDMEKLNEKDRVKAYLELMAYAEPKKAAVSADSLTPEQVEQLYDKITLMANAKGN